MLVGLGIRVTTSAVAPATFVVCFVAWRVIAIILFRSGAAKILPHEAAGDLGTTIIRPLIHKDRTARRPDIDIRHLGHIDKLLNLTSKAIQG